MSRFMAYGVNPNGRDWYVTDIHGCFGMLMALLSRCGFNEKTDRLFIGGDMVDRGPESDRVLELLALPFVYAIRGNHEQMAIDIVQGGQVTEAYLKNGGAWFAGLPTSEQQEIAAAFDALPFAMEVHTPKGVFGIVHAECPHHDWDNFREHMQQPKSDSMDDAIVEASALWARTRVTVQDETPIRNVSHVLVGHTPMKEPAQLGNVIYMDTGAVYGGRLSILCLTDLSAYWIAAAPDSESGGNAPQAH